jgi:hypothetical protein
MGFIKRDAGRWPNGVIPLKREGIFDSSSPDRNISAIASLNASIKEYFDKTAVSIVQWRGDEKEYIVIKETDFLATLHL